MTVEVINGVRYYPVKAQHFLNLGLKIPCYVKIKDTMISQSGPVGQIAAHNHISTVYIQETDLLVYTQNLIKRQKVTPTEGSKISQLAERTQLALWNLKHQGINPQNLFLLEDIAKSIVELGTNVKVAEVFSQIPPGDAQKYLIRTFLSKLLCHKLNFTSEATLYKITFASLLCDVGLYQANASEHHVHTSVAALAGLKVGGDIENIILHHHENNDGSGPLQVKRHKIHPLAKVIRVCDEFCEVLFSEKIDRTLIFQKLYQNCPNKFEMNIVRALDLCFKS